MDRPTPGVLTCPDLVRARNRIMPAPRNRRVVVVGSSNTDLVVAVERIPGPGETVLGGSLAVFAGGKGANQAVAAARAGARTGFIGAFGDDAYGLARLAELEAEGVDCSGSTTFPGKPSGVALIALVSGGSNRKSENAIVVAPGANHRLSPKTVRASLGQLAPGDVVLCSLEVPLGAVRAAASVARKLGAHLILNPAPFPPEGLPLDLLAEVEILTPNEHELSNLLGASLGTPQASRRLRALERACRKRGRAPIIVTTRGALGVDTFQSGVYSSRVVKPPRVRAVDTVGAGDCFCGALAAALASGETNLRDALRFAVAASALSVTRKGAQAAMPRKSAILALLKKVT